MTIRFLPTRSVCLGKLFKNTFQQQAAKSIIRNPKYAFMLIFIFEFMHLALYIEHNHAFDRCFYPICLG